MNCPVGVTGTQYVLCKIAQLSRFGYRLGLGLAVLYLMVIGFKYTQSKGGDMRATHKEIVILLVGVAIIILSFVIPTIMRSFIEQPAP